MRRRKFIQITSGSLAAIGLEATGCKSESPTVVHGKIVGASAQIGHLLRSAHTFPRGENEKTQVLIGGAGISGLSCARWLSLNGINDYILADLEPETGGNAKGGKNEISEFPWGAHYVPIPNNDLKEYLDFLQQAEVIESYNEKGLPFYNEMYLCSDPQERLYINGRWQDGLIPQFGLGDKSKAQIAQFLQEMERFRHAKGIDGKDAFTIPVDNSSQDELYTKLDTITMQHWLHEKQWDDEYLHWYINYCTRDDFGTNINEISAWAGIHYFAGRKGNAANAHGSDVLTWPQGNQFLAGHLQMDIKGAIRCNQLITKMEKEGGEWAVEVLDVTKKQLHTIYCKQVVLATPQFVNSRLVNNADYAALVKQHFQYCPWMVANISVNDLSEKNGAPASWDNVWHDSFSLGYVDATHQNVDQIKAKRNLTYYLPLTQSNPADERKLALEKTHAAWCEEILQDLKKVHPDIVDKTLAINVMLWGHAMIQPRPGIIHGGVRQQIRQALAGIHLAHTDMAGVSIFEEAFYQGINAAKAVLNAV